MYSQVTGRKKILYVITKSNWGGAQRYVFDLATNLPKEHYEAVVALGGTGEKGAQTGALENKLREAGVRTILVKSFVRDVSFGGDIKSFFELYKLFKKERPDVVHLNSSKAGGVGALAARFAGVPKIIFTVHGLPEDEPRNALSLFFIKLATRLTFYLCDEVITISKDNHKRVSCSTLIYNGISEINAEAINDDESKGVIVLTIAELHPNKNLLTAIKAVARARELGALISQYIIIGGGELKELLQTYITKNQYQDFISLGGIVPYEALFLKNFDIFFLPSKKEGVPYVLLEAGFLHRAVVASNVGGIPEVVEDGKGGILKSPTDVEGFALALKTLADQPNLRKQMGAHLEKKVKSEFSLERMVEETEKLYRSAS
jgi:glycosyltransferase involved in cell wall biosynthesis